MKGILIIQKNMRIHDNPALQLALEKCDSILAVYIINDLSKTSKIRPRFVFESLVDLEKNLKKYGINLVCATSNFKTNIDTFGEKIFQQDQYKAKHMISGWTLNDLDKLPKLGLTFSQFSKYYFAHPPPKPIDVKVKQVSTFSVPNTISIKDFGNKYCKGSKSHPYFIGGESTALKRWAEYKKNKSRLQRFFKPNTDPTIILTDDPSSLKGETSGMSPYLQLGCISVRKLYYDAKDIGQYSKAPSNFISQLLWRELFKYGGLVTDWYAKFPGRYEIEWCETDNCKAKFLAWKSSKTGFPWIDALMAQLRTEGWMHHLGRHCVANFLCILLWIDWEWGAAIFKKYLIDHDEFVNIANWMWLARVAYSKAYWKVYSPIDFAKKYDKEGNFVKKYLPQLRNFPAKYIYQPWEAPLDVQKKAGCIIGKDYPQPIIDYKKARTENIARFKKEITK